MNELTLIKETMSSIEIAELSGRNHKDVLESIRTMEPAWEKIAGRKFPLSDYKDSTGRKLPMYELNYQECMYVAAKFNDETRAKLVLRWDALETNKIHLSSEPAKLQDVTEAKIIAAKFTMQSLNMNDASKVLLLKAINEPLGLPVPEYVSSKGVLITITQILEGTHISAQKANKILSEYGILESRTRKSSKGKDKPFWIITEQYSDWGENEVHPQNQNEVQVKWYECQKEQILSLVREKLAA